MSTNEGVRRATGRSRDDWFAALDRWGAPGKPYRDIAGWLVDENGLSRWWAQKLVVEYEQERGLREPGVRAGGTFEVTASKTVPAPVDSVYAAVVDGRRRRSWLTDGTMSLRTARPGRSARFDWEDGTTRVSISFAASGDAKSTVAVAHELLPDARAAEKTKSSWKERLAALAAYFDA